MRPRPRFRVLMISHGLCCCFTGTLGAQAGWWRTGGRHWSCPPWQTINTQTKSANRAKRNQAVTIRIWTAIASAKTRTNSAPTSIRSTIKNVRNSRAIDGPGNGAARAAPFFFALDFGERALAHHRDPLTHAPRRDDALRDVRIGAGEVFGDLRGLGFEQEQAERRIVTRHRAAELKFIAGNRSAAEFKVRRAHGAALFHEVRRVGV